MIKNKGDLPLCLPVFDFSGVVRGYACPRCKYDEWAKEEETEEEVEETEVVELVEAEVENEEKDEEEVEKAEEE